MTSPTAEDNAAKPAGIYCSRMPNRRMTKEMSRSTGGSLDGSPGLEEVPSLGSSCSPTLQRTPTSTLNPASETYKTERASSFAHNPYESPLVAEYPVLDTVGESANTTTSPTYPEKQPSSGSLYKLNSMSMSQEALSTPGESPARARPRSCSSYGPQTLIVQCPQLDTPTNSYAQLTPEYYHQNFPIQTELSGQLPSYPYGQCNTRYDSPVYQPRSSSTTSPPGQFSKLQYDQLTATSSPLFKMSPLRLPATAPSLALCPLHLDQHLGGHQQVNSGHSPSSGYSYAVLQHTPQCPNYGMPMYPPVAEAPASANGTPPLFPKSSSAHSSHCASPLMNPARGRQGGQRASPPGQISFDKFFLKYISSVGNPNNGDSPMRAHQRPSAGDLYFHSPTNDRGVCEGFSPNNNGATRRQSSHCVNNAEDMPRYTGTSTVQDQDGTNTTEEAQSANNRRQEGAADGAESKAAVDPRKYKTRLCQSWSKTGACPYEHTCCFAHGERELRNIAENHKFLGSIAYYSNVILLSMTNGVHPALPPHALYEQPRLFPEDFDLSQSTLPAGTNFPFQAPLPAVLDEIHRESNEASRQQHVSGAANVSPDSAPQNSGWNRGGDNASLYYRRRGRGPNNNNGPQRNCSPPEPR